MLSIADIDWHLSHQGSFCLIDWLLAQDLLHYPCFEAWRYGERAHIDEALEMDRPALLALLKTARIHCDALGLCAEERDFHDWNSGQSGVLCASKDAEIHLQLTRQWLRPKDLPQPDLFMDGAAVMAENQLRDALCSRRFDDAGRHLNELVRLNGAHRLLARFHDLVNYARQMQAGHAAARQDLACISHHPPTATAQWHALTGFPSVGALNRVPTMPARSSVAKASHAAPLNRLATNGGEKCRLTAELNQLQQQMMPLARDVLGPSARDYLAFAWRRLADSMEGLDFDPANPRLHRSYALTQIPDWAAVQSSLPDLSALCQHPPLLERLALACGALAQHERALLLWCHLFEQYPDYAEAVIGQHRRQRVSELWQAFWELDGELESHFESVWFSAFILAREPGLCHHLNQMPPLKHPATLAMIALLKARLAGSNEIDARKQLKTIHPDLLRLYLSDAV